MTERDLRTGFPFAEPNGNVANAGLELSTTLALYDPNKAGTDHRGRTVPLDRATQRQRDLARLYERVSAASPPPAYELRYNQWQHHLDSARPDDTRALRYGVFPTRQRIVVGLGDESVRETSITLTRLDGVPFIPGSGIKGLVGRVARSKLFTVKPHDANDSRRLEEPEIAVISGTTDDASFFVFHDAWYVPGSAGLQDTNSYDRPLRREVMTPHNSDYHVKRGATAPAGFQSPVPVPFLSATGSYLFAIEGPDQPWVDLAWSALEFGLRVWGIGAKTSSGFGRFGQPRRAGR